MGSPANKQVSEGQTDGTLDDFRSGSPADGQVSKLRVSGQGPNRAEVRLRLCKRRGVQSRIGNGQCGSEWLRPEGQTAWGSGAAVLVTSFLVAVPRSFRGRPRFLGADSGTSRADIGSIGGGVRRARGMADYRRWRVVGCVCECASVRRAEMARCEPRRTRSLAVGQASKIHGQKRHPMGVQVHLRRQVSKKMYSVCFLNWVSDFRD